MAYKSFLVDKFETTHENKFFRKLDQKFSEAFKNIDGLHIFIGNLNVEGNRLDALFLKRGAIIVIDFKDYSGDLTFSFNNPWRIKTEKGNTIFVSGGAHSRNPYQQVNAYRFSLFQFLSNRSKEILEENHTQVSWDHTCAWILFHGNITFSPTAIPSKVDRYFTITTFDNILNDIQDVHNTQLNLCDAELLNLLKVLNITDGCRFNRELFNENEVVNNTNAGNVDRVLKLIPDQPFGSEESRAVVFYKTMVALERVNQAKVVRVDNYDIDWLHTNFDRQFVNIEDNRNFYATWLDNLSQNFPKNLFVSVNVLFDEITVPLFFTVINHTEIENGNKVVIDFNSFELFQPILEELQLTDDLIEELSNKLNEAYTLEDKLRETSLYLDVPLKLANYISCGLSDEPLFTAHLQSELNQWITGNINISSNPVFHAILKNEKIENNISITNDHIYQITSLNEGQKKAVKLSFSQPLTYVTGPPGTGKSQVVLNILANGVLKGEKVLFASRNNKAVDNVHERLSTLLDTNYFVRLGTKNVKNDHL